MANTNIYSISDTDFDEFITYRNTNKVILFYKTDCLACKVQLNDLRKLSKAYSNNINCGICDVSKLKRFAIDHDVIALPTLHIYKDKKLVYTHTGFLPYDELENEIKEKAL